MSELTILADENIPHAQTLFGPLGSVLLADGRSLAASDLGHVDVLLVRSVTQVGESLLEGSPVRFVGSATSGIDHIDRHYLQSRGIAFAHAPGANANSVVEYVLAAIAASGDHLERLMAGGSIGVVGYGHIGKALSSCLRELGIQCRIHDPWLAASGIPGAATLQQVLACDVVSLHPELTRQAPWPSFHLLGEQELLAMGTDRLLINASRGAVVDNAALLSLCKSGRAPQTVLDVWEGEPLIERQLLDWIDLGSPHIAGYSLDGKILATRMLCEAFLKSQGSAAATGGSETGGAGELTLPAALEGAGLVRHLLAQRYDIRHDSDQLRQSQESDDPEHRAAAFDQLRRNYRERRELRGTRVHAEQATDSQLRLLAGLGCSVSAATVGRGASK